MNIVIDDMSIVCGIVFCYRYVSRFNNHFLWSGVHSDLRIAIFCNMHWGTLRSEWSLTLTKNLCFSSGKLVSYFILKKKC